MLTPSIRLLREIVADLEELQATSEKTFVYFTKESHIYTLLNCIMEGGLHTKIKRSAIPELDYLSNICFELYESKDSSTLESAYSIRISISPGCHAFDPLNITLDSKHSIGLAPRRSLTDHQPWKDVISILKSRCKSLLPWKACAGPMSVLSSYGDTILIQGFNAGDQVKLPSSFLAVNVSAQHERDAKGAGELLQEDDGQVQTNSAVEGAPTTDE